jgi:hypothetical protein
MGALLTLVSRITAQLKELIEQSAAHRGIRCWSLRNSKSAMYDHSEVALTGLRHLSSRN